MTARLENAIRTLSPEDLERVTRFAESLTPRAEGSANHLKLDWAGAAGEAYPEYESGVDAAHAAMRLIREEMNRELSR